MFQLTGKNALITGAASGIGRAIAETFARQGATVWVVDRDEANGAEVVAAIRAAGGVAEFAALDVSDEAAAVALASRLPALDVLVNNAGVAGPGGGTAGKPVGLVWIGCAMARAETEAARHVFPGDRAAIREQTVAAALGRLLQQAADGASTGAETVTGAGARAAAAD